MEPSWKFDWAMTWEEILSPGYQAAWRALFDSPDRVGPPSPFYHPAVVKSLLDAAGGPKFLEPYFLTATSSEGFVVRLPLMRERPSWRQGRTRRLVPLGGGQFDYHDPIVTKAGVPSALPASFWSELLSHLERDHRRAFDEVSLPRVRAEHSPSGPIWSSSGTAPYLALDRYHDMSAFMRARRKSLRTDVNRQLKRLAEHGNVEYRSSRDAPEDEVRGWMRRLEISRTARFPGASVPVDFLRNLLEQATGPAGPAHFSALLVGGKDIAWHAGFTTKHAAFWYLPGFDDQFGDFSPGKIHLFFALDEAMRCKLGLFDFLRGTESYKASWTDGEEFSIFGCRRFHRTPLSLARRMVARVVRKIGAIW